MSSRIGDRMIATQPTQHILLIDTLEILALLDNWLCESFLSQLPENTLLILPSRDAPSAAWCVDLGEILYTLALRNPDWHKELHKRARVLHQTFRTSTWRYATTRSLRFHFSPSRSSRRTHTLPVGQPPRNECASVTERLLITYSPLVIAVLILLKEIGVPVPNPDDLLMLAQGEEKLFRAYSELRATLAA